MFAVLVRFFPIVKEQIVGFPSFIFLTAGQWTTCIYWWLCRKIVQERHCGLPNSEGCVVWLDTVTHHLLIKCQMERGYFLVYRPLPVPLIPVLHHPLRAC